MDHTELNWLLNFFKALANENRLKILAILANRECSVEELAALLKLREPTVTHHLAIMKSVDLVEMRVDGNTHLHRLNFKAVEAMSKDILSKEKLASLDSDVEYDAWERKVLNSYLENGQLKEIPARRKKRNVILKWLVNQFEENVKYSEFEVNDLIQRYHPDSATLRREFIAEKLMVRDNGVYWRMS